MDEKIVQLFDLERETKNTAVFAARADGTPPAVQTIYINKWAMPKIGDAKAIRLEIVAE